MIMGLCVEKTFEESWNCMVEVNGDLLPLIIFVECMWWLMVMVGMRFGVQSIRKWFTKRRMQKQAKLEWNDKWEFPPQKRKN